MNAEFAKWETTPIPVDWMQYRNQWEYAHAINACIKIMGLSFLTIAVLLQIPENRVQ